MSDEKEIWQLDRWRGQPNLYHVRKQTAKTLKVYRPHWSENTIMASDIGRTWFWTEREAYQQRVKNVLAEIAILKQKLQDARTQLGIAESKVAVLAGGSISDGSLPPQDGETR